MVSQTEIHNYKDNAEYTLFGIPLKELLQDKRFCRLMKKIAIEKDQDIELLEKVCK